MYAACIDLSTTYKSIVKTYFPNAKIVADRFHVIRLVNQQCLSAYQQIDPGLKYHRGLLAALRTNPDNLTAKRRALRDHYLVDQPAVAAIYEFKQALHVLLMHEHQTKQACREHVHRLLDVIKQLKQSGFKSLRILGSTLYQWREEIACV